MFIDRYQIPPLELRNKKEWEKNEFRLSEKKMST